MFYERLNLLCKLNGTNITAVSTKHLGVANSTATSWKNGAAPRCDVVVRAAQHFHVTTDYLLGLTDDPGAAYPQTDAEQAIQAAAESLRNASEPARTAALAALHAILSALDENER